MSAPRLVRRALSLLVSSAPWRALGYLQSSAIVVFVWGGLFFEVSSWVVGWANTLLGIPGATATVVVTAAILLPAGSVALSAVERFRLRLVDPAPAPSRHPRLVALPLSRRLLERWREAATWWEVAYALLLAVALAWVDFIFSALIVVVPVALIGFPFEQNPFDPRNPFDFASVVPGLHAHDSLPAALAVSALGLLLLPVAGVLLVGFARVRVTIARLLLVGPGDSQVTARLRQLTQSRSRIVDAFQSERRRIERDLHDGAQQRLTAAIATLGLARLELAEGPPAARQLVIKAQAEVRETLAELRRLVQGIHPQVLTNRGLEAAIEELAARVPLPVDVDVRLPRLPEAVESAGYFVMTEAMTNVVKHSGARRSWIRGRCRGGSVHLEIGDDGRGGADPVRGSGLLGLGDRVAALDGRLAISSPPGGPTVLRAELPCGS